MWIGCLEIEVRLPGVNSLKEKRMVLKSVKDRIHGKYNVSIAEIDALDKWQRAVLGIVCVSRDKRLINSLLDNIVNLFDGLKQLYIIDYNLSFLNE